MYYPTIKLRKIEAQYNSFGAKTGDLVVETEVPILRIEKVKSTEFYKANEQGYKPELRLRISNLNYDGEQEFEYGDKIYSVIRTEDNINDILIIAQKKIKNNKENKISV